MLMLIGRGIDATNAANTKLDMKTFKKLMLIKLQVTDEMNSGREKQIDDWWDLLAVNSVWIRKSCLIAQQVVDCLYQRPWRERHKYVRLVSSFDQVSFELKGKQRSKKVEV